MSLSSRLNNIRDIDSAKSFFFIQRTIAFQLIRAESTFELFAPYTYIHICIAAGPHRKKKSMVSIPSVRTDPFKFKASNRPEIGGAIYKRAYGTHARFKFQPHDSRFL